MPTGIVSNVERGSILSVCLLYHEQLHLLAGSFARQHLFNYNKLIDLIEKIEKDWQKNIVNIMPLYKYSIAGKDSGL